MYDPGFGKKQENKNSKWLSGPRNNTRKNSDNSQEKGFRIEDNRTGGRSQNNSSQERYDNKKQSVKKAGSALQH